jgi:SAM-dependent methyltransferase
MNTDMKEIKEKVKQYYDDHLRAFGFTAKGMGWRSEDAQVRRFEELCKLIGKGSFSINDLGCGSGDLLAHLQKHYNDFTYQGYDQLENMVAFAKNRFSGSNNAVFHQITDPSQIKPADYTVACGIFNLRYQIPDKEWLAYVLSTIQIMHRASPRGIAFNMLTRYSDPERMIGELFYGDPPFMFDFCKRNLSRNVALLHDYDEYDFTIIVRE